MAYTVFVVEDDKTLQETLAYNLSRQGYEVMLTNNGRDALEMARDNPPDLILLDVMLPGMDGFEVCRILRKEMRLPILMLTARTEEVDKIVGLEMGEGDMAQPGHWQGGTPALTMWQLPAHFEREQVQLREAGIEGWAQLAGLEDADLRRIGARAVATRRVSASGPMRRTRSTCPRCSPCRSTKLSIRRSCTSSPG